MRATVISGMAALAAVALSACGGGAATTAKTVTHTVTTGSSATAVTATRSVTAQSPTSPVASSTSPSPTATSGTGVAAPGTSLAAGQTAIVLYTPPLTTGKSYKLAVTVQSIQKGSLADFNGIQLDATQKASIPYYVTARLVDLSPGNAASGNNDPSDALDGLDNTGQQQQSVTFFGNFPRCNAVSAPDPFTHGQSFETCLTFLVPGGITHAAWTGTDNYINSPVTWKP